jgi:hypothetical protein
MATYTPLQSITLTSSQTSVTFNNIDQTYTDLILVINAAISSGTADNYLKLGTNGIDTGTNFSYTILRGNGSIATSTHNSGVTYIDLCGATAIDSAFGLTTNVHLNSYSNPNTYKTALIRSSNAANGADEIVGLWKGLTPITTIQLSPSASTYSAGSTFSLYGIRGNATPKAFGGNIVKTDGTYWYHAFLSSGSFTPTQPLTCDVLVVAGAGGGGGTGNGSNGGYPGGGGGGAGGLLYQASQALDAGTSSTVIVGSGGAGKYLGTGSGSSGTNSSLGSYVAIGGGGGASWNGTPLSGGSGGGADGSGNTTTAGAAGTAGQGYAGGSWSSGINGGAGGGGATAVGGAGSVSSNSTGGAGGAGSNAYSSWLSATGLGVAGYIAGGGGGGSSGTSTNTPAAGAGGAGGGGQGGQYNVASTVANGTSNTGGGGGGAGQTNTTTGLTGGTGGSGIVIVRYPV